ncbi:hypothetical protein [Streptomyces sp. NPDC048411]|uniref:hypothetical protein n=1 Tax=Streptomyces sp. NPDC048411 TaxID=3157206 RepID=UPI003453DEBC
MASVGALAGLLTPLVRALVLGGVGVVLAHDLLVFTDPLTGWGHPLALLVGVAYWPLLHRREGRVGAVMGAVPPRRVPRRTRQPAKQIVDEQAENGRVGRRASSRSRSETPGMAVPRGMLP